MSHFDFEKRKIIANMLSKKARCVEIAEICECDPTAVAKEVKRNRMITKEAKLDKKILCKKLDKRPYTCIDCRHKYTDCVLTQMRYEAKYAQMLADARLHNSRKGIDLTNEEALILTDFIKNGLENKKSLYAISKESPIQKSISTLYRYIQYKKIDVSKTSLPYAVSYKKRKKQNEKYDYPENGKINRNNRTFLDFLSYTKAHRNEMTVQMDFLGSIRTDRKSILVLIIPEIHFPFLFLIENKNASKVVDVFNNLEQRLGTEKFKEIIPSIITDRDPSFSDFTGIEFSPFTGEQRTFIFYCDAFKSNQKASVENMNKQLRKWFPKGQSVDNIPDEKIKEINYFIVDQKIRSLDGKSPKDAFILLFGEKAFIDIFK